MLDALLFSKTPPLLKTIYPDCLWKVNTTEKKIYLTFDDGPIPEITPYVLDELKKWNAHATFFCIGKNMETNPEIFQRIVSEGHSTGNHTYNHLNGWSYSNKDYFENIEKCDSVIAGCGLRNADLFRPPYGKLTPSQYRHLKKKYRIAMWDVLAFDFDLNVTAEKVVENVLKHAEAGSIIVMHDSVKAKPKVEFALPIILNHFSEKGFKFEKL